MDYVTLRCDMQDHILTLTLNRPQAMNAFTVQMSRDLIAAFDAASEDDAVRAVILTGSGKAFCAGMDLSVPGNVFGLNERLTPTWQDMRDRIDEQEVVEGVRDTGGMVTLAMYRCKKPVIAAINGAAVGIGATMTLAADVRLASENARIGFVFGRIGIVPEACSSWFLPRLVGISQALEWTLSAEIIDAAEALRGGLVREVVAPDALLERALHRAHAFTRNRSAVGVALTRQMMWRNAALPSPLEAHRVDSLAMFYTSIGDGKEGVKSFLDKREPGFRSRASDEMPPFYPWWPRES